ncbi:AAA family ATPase [Acidimicrobium ferrooxidans]|nr:AAA family ATPase [Acidimicrobium ferrooxidans]
MRKILSRYSLTKLPFSKDVPVEEFLELKHVRATIRRIKAAIEGKSCAVLTGETGTGKTFISRAVASMLSEGRYRVSYLHNATLNRRDFYRQLSTVLGLQPIATAEALFRAVSLHLEEMAGTQQVHPVILIDEAHMLPISVLEHFHILLNFQWDSKAYLSLVLVGLPSLRDMLHRNVLSSLAARLPVRVQLDSLDARQVGEYLNHRMTMAGCSQEVFSEDGILLIAEATSGSMRRINVLAETSLQVALNGKGSLVDASVVEGALKLCAGALM